jgi:hypothetical protein
MEKINFKNNEAPYLSGETFNQMQDNIEEALEEHYSLEETFTGKYWIDGKKIYRKVITINDTSTKNLGVDINTVVNSFLIIKTEDAWRPIPWLFGQNQDDVLGSWVAGYFIKVNKLVMQFGSDLSTFTVGYFTIEYTKTTD